MSHGVRDAKGATPAAGRQFLTFYLENEEYGVEIRKVQEIIGMLPITRDPRTPAFMRGVVNLRGAVIPIVDLRLKFGLERVEPTPRSCIVVVQVRGSAIGLVVDRVSEVATLGSEEIEDAPSFGSDVQTEYLLGIGKAGGRIRLLVDIEKVLSTSEVLAVTQAHGMA
jgi:purine-binding chemotaxis protein CheW